MKTWSNENKSIRLIHGDCLEAMDKLIEEGVKVDCIITSPPYNKAGYEGFIRKRHNKDSWSQRNVDYGNDETNDFMPENEYQEWQIRFLNKCLDILKEDGSIFYNHKVRVAKHKASHPIEWILKSNCVFRQQITWDKKGSPAVSPIRYLPNTELIFWLTKKQAQPNFNRNKNIEFLGEVWSMTAKDEKEHPAPFPKELPTNIIKCLNLDKKVNLTVLDPFNGVGTVGEVCKELNVNYIGVEKIKKYYDISVERLGGK